VEISRGLAGPGLSAAALRDIHEPQFVSIPAAPGRPTLRAFVLPTTEGQRLFVVVGSAMTEVSQTLASLRLLLEMAGPAALALACLAAWVLAGTALRPVERMRREAAAISVSQPKPTAPGTGREGRDRPAGPDPELAAGPSAGRARPGTAAAR